MIANHTVLTAFLGIAAGIWALPSVASEDGPRPNIVVILSDDQGFADIGFNREHSREVSTPHMDALAREGVWFSQAYISGNVCSPTRAGLMLGRYQQRVGVYTAGQGGRGFDPEIPIFPAMLGDSYARMAVGKWHLGLDDDYPRLSWHPCSRGFDESYNFMGRGAHDYFQLHAGLGNETGPIYRNKQRIDDEGYLTTRLTEEAVAFIGRNKARPFFLYLAYNAVHAPKQAPREDVERYRKLFPDIPEDRQILMAMLYHLDLGVGAVVNKLKDEKLWDNTLLFFLTDNGGAKGMMADNAPLRGFKGSHYEGGIRTPFVVSWPAAFKGGRTIATPVISLDILPTALDAARVPPPKDTAFDGKSLLPLLTGTSTRHHAALFWSDEHGTGGDWAVRQGDWKLHSIGGQTALTNLATDPAEARNLAAKHPGRVAALTALFDEWIGAMPPPLTAPAPRKRQAEPLGAAD
ncbi:MAG: sulfatase-like hydrolase/transferase [Planctomycetota bacterium]|nr:sulfatase-like hydrolase/transferase [Planctomycetota bacterium]